MKNPKSKILRYFLPFCFGQAALSLDYLDESLQVLYLTEALSQQEFVVWVQEIGGVSRARARRERKLTSVFRLLDADGSGALSKKQSQNSSLVDQAQAHDRCRNQTPDASFVS